MQVLKIGTVAAADHVLAAAGGRFDADHVRAPVGEMAHAGGACTCQREIEDDDAGQR